MTLFRSSFFQPTLKFKEITFFFYAGTFSVSRRSISYFKTFIGWLGPRSPVNVWTLTCPSPPVFGWDSSFFCWWPQNAWKRKGSWHIYCFHRTCIDKINIFCLYWCPRSLTVLHKYWMEFDIKLLKCYIFYMDTWSYLFISLSPRNLQSHYLISVRDINIYLPIHPSKTPWDIYSVSYSDQHTAHHLILLLKRWTHPLGLSAPLSPFSRRGNEIVTVACIFISLCSAWILALQKIR